MGRRRVKGGNADHVRLLRDLERAGYDVAVTGGSHVRVRSDDGRTCILAMSPRGGALKRQLADLKRYVGYDPRTH